MLTKITLENFKVFRHATEFPLAKINLLTGINGRGKSSLLQSLLLMRQSIEHNENTTELILNGNCVHLGTWEDVKNKDEKEDKEIKFTFDNNFKIVSDKMNVAIQYSLSEYKKTNLSINQISYLCDNKLLAYKKDYNSKFFTANIHTNSTRSARLHNLIMPFDSALNYFVTNNTNKEDGIIVSQDNENNNDFEIQFNENFEIEFYEINEYIFSTIHYIAADRIGAKDYYPKTLNLGNFITIDKKGENTVDILLHYKEKQVHENLYREKNEFNGLQNLGQDLETQVGEWIGWVLDADVKVIFTEIDEFRNTLQFEINGKKFKPVNVGFGYSYILPIITAGLIANEGEILIVENPEAHLHPKAQSRLTEFLAKVAATGVQVFVESHSEHILNGLRIATLKKDIDLTNEDVSVLYFQDVENQPFIRLNIEKDGSIKNWVEGFFDQQEIDLSEIFKLNRAKK